MDCAAVPSAKSDYNPPSAAPRSADQAQCFSMISAPTRSAFVAKGKPVSTLRQRGASAPDHALVGGPRLAGGARQPVRLQQHMDFLDLRPQREADQDKGR